MSDAELTPPVPSENELDGEPNYEATAGVKAFITLRSELSKKDVTNING